MDSPSFTAFLTTWRGDRTNVECGRLLSIDGGTFGTWLLGQRVPPGARRADVASVLGITPAEVEALIAADRIRGMPGADRVGIRIDTPAEAQAWIDFKATRAEQPVPAQQGG